MVVAFSALGLVVLAGALAGGRSLLGRLARPSLRVATARAEAETFVLITFVSTPAGARIVDGGGQTVGTTPATLPVTPSQIVVSFRFQMDGYQEATASVVPNGDRTISIELKPARRVEKAERKPRPPRRATHGP